MQRTRDIAGSPVRSASAVWATMCQLITDTLTRSPHIAESDVTTALAAAAPAAMMLTAAGHLEADQLVLVAGELELAIGTVSGDKALNVDENLNPVPGASQAREWTLHFPTPEPVGASIASLLSGIAHLSTEAPDTAAATVPGESARQSSMLNLESLRARRSQP